MSNGLFDFSSGIEFQPATQARFEAWVRDPKNAPAIMTAAKRRDLITGGATAGYKAALDAGILTPVDFANPVSNPSNISVDAKGDVHINEGLTKGMGPLLAGTAAAVGGGLLAGGAGATSSASAATAAAPAADLAGWGDVPAVTGSDATTALEDGVTDGAWSTTPDLTPVAGGGGGSSALSLLSKYGLPAIAGAAGSYLQNRQSAAAIAQRAQEARTNAAVAQAKLDPFRNVMHQTADIGQLEHAATPPPSYGPRAGSPYMAAAAPQAPLQLSSGYLASLRTGQGLIAAGQAQAPDQTDPALWGQTGVPNLTTPGTSFAPATPGAPNALQRYRRGLRLPGTMNPPPTWKPATA